MKEKIVAGPYIWFECPFCGYKQVDQLHINGRSTEEFLSKLRVARPVCEACGEGHELRELKRMKNSIVAVGTWLAVGELAEHTRGYKLICGMLGTLPEKPPKDWYVNEYGFATYLVSIKKHLSAISATIPLLEHILRDQGKSSGNINKK